MDQELLYWFIGLMVVIGIESLLLVFVIWKTPALTFLKASLLKRNLVYIIGKDRLGMFKTFTPESGAAKLGKEGIFHLTENSSTLEVGSKIPIYVAFRDLAATLLPEYPAIIQELREKGLKISNIEDVNDYILQIKKGAMDDIPVNVHAYKTYKMHDLENLFPNNLDPTFIDATVQCEISKGLKMVKLAPTIFGGIVVLLVVGAVAIYILNMAFSGQITVEDCKAMIETVKQTASSLNITNLPDPGPIAN
jgi:hypothetical protein